MKSIEQIIQPYIELEITIRELMGRLFSDTCGICTACCCRADICEEATQSAFLSLLLERQGQSAATMDDRFGWLDLHGCSLGYGRPPVCYAFFCDELLARLPDEEARWVVRILGRLIEYVGENGYNGAHLVEIMNREDLRHIDPAAISRRLEKATAALEVIEHYLDTGRLLKTDRDRLAAFAGQDT